MAADTDFHQTRCNSWSHPEIRSESQNNQAGSVSELLGHGSISFGRFAVESLAWEKWSVFSHNKCREELERFMAPGFVAQKKAYFEEYYRKIREMKASQAEQQELETNQPGSEHDVESSVSQMKTGMNAADSKQENLSSYGTQIQALESDGSTNFVSSCGNIVEKQEAATRELTSCRINSNERVSTNDKTSNSLCPPETENSTKEVQSSTHVAGDSEISQHARLVSNANKPKTQANVAAAQSKTRMGYGNSKDGIKSSKKTKTSPQKKNTGKADNSALLSKSNTHKAADCNNSVQVLSCRRPKEVSTSYTTLRTSLVRNRLESSSSRGISDQTRTNLGRKDLADKLSSSLTGYGQSVQKTLKESVPSGLKLTVIDNRSKIVPGQNELSQNGEAQVGPRSHVRERKQKDESTISHPTNLTNTRNEPRVPVSFFKHQGRRCPAGVDETMAVVSNQNLAPGMTPCRTVQCSTAIPARHI